MTAISKSVYFDVLDAILHRNSNTVHRTLHLILMLNTMKTLMKKIINLKLVVVSEYQNSKIFLLKDTLKIGQKKFLSLSKLKTQLRGYMQSWFKWWTNRWKFLRKELQKTSQEKFRVEKVTKRKGDKLYVKWKGYNNSFNSWIDKKDRIKMSQYFPKPLRSFGGNINVKLGLSNYATKTDLINATHVDTSRFALKTNLASLKTEVDKLDIDKLAPVPVDLSKLSDVVKNDVVKKAVYDKLAAKVNNIDTSAFVLKTKYQTDRTELEKKIPNVTDFVKETKLTEL